MTKEKLLKLIELFGSFWYVYDSYCPAMHCPTILWFKNAPASDVDRFNDLINDCVEHPVRIQIYLEYGILVFIAAKWGAYKTDPLYPSCRKGVFANYSDNDINEIMEMQ